VLDIGAGEGGAPKDGAPTTALVTSSNVLHLRGVYLRGFGRLARFSRSGVELAAPSGGAWAAVHEYVHGEDPPPHRFDPRNGSAPRMLQNHAPVVADMVRLSRDVANVSATDTPPPRSLIRRHALGEVPRLERAGALNVRAAPFFAMGDAAHDDAPAIQAQHPSSLLAQASFHHRMRPLRAHAPTRLLLELVQAALEQAGPGGTVLLPRGFYRVSRTLRVPQGVALVGVAHHLCVVAPTIGGLSADAAPLVHMLAPGVAHAAVTGSVLSQLMLVSWRTTAGAFAWQWDAAGDGNVLRQVGTRIAEGVCEKGVDHPSCPPVPTSTTSTAGGWAAHACPMTLLRGAGRFFVVRGLRESNPHSPGPARAAC
jgi:hypothetical protein